MAHQAHRRRSDRNDTALALPAPVGLQFGHRISVPSRWDSPRRGPRLDPARHVAETARVVINSRLGDRVETDPAADSMGRSWYGYEPTCSPADLWNQNRGVYGFAIDKIEAERFASISYRGDVLVVADLSDWEWFVDPTSGVWRKALIGDVLGPGDAAYDVLITQTVPSARNPIGYFDDEGWGVAEVTARRPRRAPGGNGPSRPSGQGWQSDPVRRKQVEDAAQDRLMAHYVSEGWEVEDTRFGHSYDAVARRGEETVYLEAKGTETRGAEVLVSAGEVNHARAHLGQCVMGVLSDIRFDAEGNLDADSGTFRMMAFEPAYGSLTPTGYRWSLPGA